MSWLLDAVYFIAAFNLAFATGCYWYGSRNPRRSDDDETPTGIGA